MNTAKISRRLFYPLGLAILLLQSCKDEYSICEQQRISTANGGFVTIAPGGTEAELTPAALTVRLLNNTAVYNNVAGLNIFSLPLVANADSSKFIIKTNTVAPVDTLTLFYSTQTILLSDICGSINTYTLSNATTTKHDLDSVKIVDVAVGNRLTRNLKLYY